MMNVRIFVVVLFHRTQKQSGLTTVPTSLIPWDVSLAAAALLAFFGGTSAAEAFQKGVDPPLTLLSKKTSASSLQPSNEQLFCIPAGI